MTWAVTAILFLFVLWFLGEGFVDSRKFYEFPFLAGVMTFSFIIPQLPGILMSPLIPEGDYIRTIAVAISCLVMLRLGWAGPAEPLHIFRQKFDERRLLVVAMVFSLVGAAFYYKLSHLPGEISIGVQMTGMPVVYLFFARLLTYGLAIALLCFARRPSKFAALLILIDLVFYLERIVITGKRAEAVELVMMIVLAFWFQRRWVVPRWAIVAGLAAGLVTTTSMADYRQITRANDGPVLDQISEIDITKNLETLIEQGGDEMSNAIERIGTVSHHMQLDYGKIHWNRLVFNFVPAQLVGSSIKNSLMFALPPPARDYTPLTGTTETGMADAFQSFWYFGALKFFLLAYVVFRIWTSAMAGWTSAQLAYMLSIVPAMHSISHLTDWVIQVWVHMGLFLVPALLFALVIDHPSGPRPLPSGSKLPAHRPDMPLAA
ncbi:hypothetical protein [Mesorhizobium sp. A623]